MEINKDKTLQAHGMTHSEMEDLHVKQVTGEKIESVPANNGGDKIGDRFFKADYEKYRVPYHEEGDYHVAVEARTFIQSGPEPIRTSVSAIKKFSPEMYKFMIDTGAFKGQVVHILHNPELGKNVKPDIHNQRSAEEVAEENNPGVKPDFNRMTIAELTEYYQEKTGNAMPSGLKKKDDIIEAIEEL